MTNAISIGSTPVSPAASAARAKPAAGDTGFANLIDLSSSTGSAPRHIGTTTPGTPAAETTAPETALDGLLGQLVDTLSTLLEKLRAGEGLDDTDRAGLEDLLAGIEALIAEGVPLPAPDSPALAALSELGLGIDGDPASPTRTLDILSALVAKLAEETRDGQPDLAARLTGLSRTLDEHAAVLQTALAGEKSGLAAGHRQAQSETALSAPSAAIAETEQAPEPEPARPQGQPRAIGAPAEGTPDRAPATNGAEQTRPATAAAAATVPTDPASPDSLAPQAPQPQVQPPAATAIRPEAAIYQRPDPQINLPFIAAEIARHVQNGVSRFEIRLNPPELGRIDVRMEMDTSGNLVARLAVERSETLDLLQRDQRSLERALAEAGLDAGRTDLQFSLQQEAGQNRDGDEKPAWRAIATPETETPATALNAEQAPYLRGYARLDAVNLWV